MNKKYYVNNGYNKRVLTAKSAKDATIIVLKELLGNDPDGKENCELYPYSVVSEYGFVQDILAIGNYDELDKCAYFKTSKIMASLGRKDIATHLEEFEKTLPQDVRKILKAM